MKKVIIFTLSLLLTIAASGEQTFAKSSKSSPQQSSKSSSSRPSSNNNSSRPTSYKGKPVTIVKDSRPKSVSKLPATKYPIKHNGVNYYRSKSKYYKMVNGKYIWTPPPFGLRVPIIPAIHTIFRFNNINYYSSEGVIYREYGNEYEIVEPQMSMVVPELPMVNVSQVNIDGMTYFEFDGILYKQIPTVSGIQYKVIGSLYD